MNVSRTIASLLLLTMAWLAQAQPWIAPYDRALEAVRAQRWAEARAAFKEAAAVRKDDSAKGTTLPGPVTERKQWRDGSPYSPNFGAAYAGIKQAMSLSDDVERTVLLREVAAEFEKILDKNQHSKEAYYFLNIAYQALQDGEDAKNLEARFQKSRKRLNWKVDPDLVGPEEMAAIEDLAIVDATATTGGAAASIQTNPTNPTPPRREPRQPEKKPDPPVVDEPVRQPQTNPTNPANPVVPRPVRKPGPKPTDDIIIPGAAPSEGPSSPGGPVPTLDFKYAFIVANTEGKIAEIPTPDFAINDALAIRDALVSSAGYAEDNVIVVENATAAEILAAAKSLAERVPEDGTVFFFFAGAGANIDGKDFLAGVDAESPTDSARMVAKEEVFRAFMAKGASIFAFFEVNRPILEGKYFGMDAPLAGSIAQVQGTIPGGSVLGFVRGGKSQGVFGSAMAAVLVETRMNRVPILEYSWQVFYRMRRGNTGTEGGGSAQTPTLPQLTNIASDARF